MIIDINDIIFDCINQKSVNQLMNFFVVSFKY